MTAVSVGTSMAIAASAACFAFRAAEMLCAASSEASRSRALRSVVAGMALLEEALTLGVGLSCWATDHTFIHIGCRTCGHNADIPNIPLTRSGPLNRSPDHR